MEIFNLGLSFYLMLKNRKIWVGFFILNFLHFIKQKRGPL